MLLAGIGWAGPAPRLDQWRVIGPGGGGSMFLPTVSPHDPNLVLEHCDMTGSYISLDAGRSWRMFNLRGVVSTFAYDPNDRNIIYAGNQALWRSADTGRTWSMVLPDPKKNTVEHMRGDHAAPLLTTADPAYPGGAARVRFIAVDPADSKRIYVLFGGRARGSTRLCFSRDRGAHWTEVSGLAGFTAHAMYFDGALILAGDSAVLAFRRRAAGARRRAPWRTRSFGRRRPRTALRHHRGGHARRHDGGKNWSTNADPLPRRRASAISPAPNISRNGVRRLLRYAHRRRQLVRPRQDHRRRPHWASVYQESRARAANVEAAWIEGFYEGTGPIRDIGVSPGQSRRLLCDRFLFRTFRTLDGGKTWQQVNSVHVADDRWTTTGLDVTTNYGVHFDPFDARHMFISYTDMGLFQSDDGGATWTSCHPAAFRAIGATRLTGWSSTPR